MTLTRWVAERCCSGWMHLAMTTMIGQALSPALKKECFVSIQTRTHQLAVCLWALLCRNSSNSER